MSANPSPMNICKSVHAHKIAATFCWNCLKVRITENKQG
jgi:hypothetical protein